MKWIVLTAVLLTCLAIVEAQSTLGEQRIDQACSTAVLERDWQRAFTKLGTQIEAVDRKIGKIEEQSAMNSKLADIQESMRLIEKRLAIERRNDTENVNITAMDCNELHREGHRLPGQYKIKARDSDQPFTVYCDMTETEAWTYLLRRKDGTTAFDRTWDEYRAGFGDPSSNHWIGNDNIYALTKQAIYELRIDFTYHDVDYYASYDFFKIASEKAKYKLTHLGRYIGNAPGGDQLVYHKDSLFSTKDKDNDVYGGSCANASAGGGWWYKHCNVVNLTGKYGCRSSDCIHWGNSDVKFYISNLVVKLTRR